MVAVEEGNCKKARFSAAKFYEVMVKSQSDISALKSRFCD